MRLGRRHQNEVVFYPICQLQDPCLSESVSYVAPARNEGCKLRCCRIVEFEDGYTRLQKRLPLSKASSRLLKGARLATSEPRASSVSRPPQPDEGVPGQLALISSGSNCSDFSVPSTSPDLHLSPSSFHMSTSDVARWKRVFRDPSQGFRTGSS